MSRYKAVSEQIFDIFLRFTPLVEPLSIDEAFLDVTGSMRLFGTPVHIAKTIKNKISKEIGLTVSAGVAPNKFVAKIASDMEKPDGLTVVRPDRVAPFLDPLPITKMWGVGKVTQTILSRLNIRTFKDLSRLSEDFLERKFGKHGPQMRLLSMGLDDREVIPDHEVKSIGHELTFSQDILKIDDAKKQLLFLADKVARRMRRKRVKGRTVTLKVKYGDFIQITRSSTLHKSIDDGLLIYSTVCPLLQKTKVGDKPVRLLGVSVSHLNMFGSGEQLSLFQQEKKSKKRDELNAALDSLHNRFGEKSIVPGSLIDGED